MKMQCFGPKNGYRFSAHAAAISNRFRGFSYPNLSFAATYRSSRFQRWDSTDLKFEISDAFAFLSGLTYFAAHHLKFRMRIPSPLILTNLLKRNTSSGSRKSQFLIRPIKLRLDRPANPRALRRYLLQQSRQKRSPLRHIALTNPPHAISPIRSNIPANRMHA